MNDKEKNEWKIIHNIRRQAYIKTSLSTIKFMLKDKFNMIWLFYQIKLVQLLY